MRVCALQPRMQAALRHELIRQILDETGLVTVLEIASRCRVSEMTARRDLDHLAGLSLLRRTHGGAIAVPPAEQLLIDLVEPSVAARAWKNREAKAAIAACACQMIAPDQFISLDIGTTAAELALRLKNQDIGIFTNSLTIGALLRDGTPKVYMPGGRVSGTEPSITGAQAVEQLRSYCFDIAFLGASGFSQEGFFDYSVEDTEIKQAVIEQSHTNVMLIDGSKFDRLSVARITRLEGIDVVITDKPPPEPLAAALSDAGVRIKLAEPATGENVK